MQLTIEKEVLTTTCTLIADPRLKATQADFDAQQAMLSKIDASVKDIHGSVNRMRKVKSQIENLTALLKNNKESADLVENGKEVLKKISTWEEQLITPKQETFQDVINFYNRLNAELMDLKSRVDVHDPRLTAGAQTRMTDLMEEWTTHKTALEKLITVDVAKFNDMYKQKALPALIVPDR